MRLTSENNFFFTRQLLKWNDKKNDRQMPWKGEKDPYKIWLSEIILQQTRVAQGLEYYNRFIKTFPTIHDLAKAPEITVFKLWEGLGYYTRCKNLIATAKYISSDLKGKFPNQYDNILALKGIGPYTAAAIGSFAFNLPHAVVDGNVFRVLARYFNIQMPVDTTEGKKYFTTLANELLDKKQPGIYNQALMDFGAIICKPRLPLCSECMLNKNCKAYLEKKVNDLPVKEKFIIRKTRWFYFLIIEYKNSVYIKKRDAGDIWENLYQFVLVENTAALAIENLKKIAQVKSIFGKNKVEVVAVSGLHKQQLTHQTIAGQFITIKIDKPLLIKGYERIEQGEIKKLPFPKFISNYLKDKNVSLNLL